MKCTDGKQYSMDVHSWVLVPQELRIGTIDQLQKFLWACPCGEFKWTSYAEWETRPKPQQQSAGGTVTQGLGSP